MEIIVPKSELEQLDKVEPEIAAELRRIGVKSVGPHSLAKALLELTPRNLYEEFEGDDS